MNLLPRELIHDSESLPRVLAKAGYHTAYVTDEVRFSNIDTSYGFDQVITPPIGASEFLIGKLADTPLSNLLVNTRVAGWLFPHVYANRGAADTYDPDVFVERIDRELRTAQPLFATVHLTLGHWPYTWGGAPIKARALLAGEPGNIFGEITPPVLNVDFGFSHISACVDAFRGVPYPYSIASCP